jgi:hypothetical protein
MHQGTVTFITALAWFISGKSTLKNQLFIILGMRFGKNKDRWIQIVSWVMLLNFINLSANFYQTSASNSIYEIHADPIDSVSELLFEYVMDMAEDTIPDTEVPEQKRKIKDLKVFYQIVKTQGPTWTIQTGEATVPVSPNDLDPIDLARISPPPKNNFFV